MQVEQKPTVNYPQAVLELIERYKEIQKTQSLPKLPSIQHFRQQIHFDQTLRMQFQGALDQIPEEVPSFDRPQTRKTVLFNMTIDQVLDLLNIAVQTPPRFIPSMFIGVPVSAFFVDLMNTELGKALFSGSEVKKRMRDIVQEYGKMLKTKKSLKYLNDGPEGWLSPEALKYINYDHIVCDQSAPHYGFKCWNNWFVRDLVEGARPVDGVDDPLVIVHPTQNHALTIQPVTNILATDKFWLKENRYSLYDMFEAKKMEITKLIDELFVGGSLYQGFLSPWCYHQWHSPVSGVVEKFYWIEGTLFLQNPNFDIKSSSSNFPDSLPFLSSVSARCVYIINTENENVGRVALIKIGMNEVSSCVPTVQEGQRVVKGQTIGRFEFGGSSNVILFEKKVKLQFSPKLAEKQVIDGREVPAVQLVNTMLAKVIA